MSMKICVLLLCIALMPLSGAGEAHEELPRDELLKDAESRTITFPAQVQKSSGDVQFFVHMRGYDWLEEDSALISYVSLKDLQLAAAEMNWRAFDDLWFSNRRVHEITMTLSWEGMTVSAWELIEDDDPGDAARLLFWGSPYFDHIALDTRTVRDCRTCPVFPMEQELIRREFPDRLVLREPKMPDEGTWVTVTLEVGR